MKREEFKESGSIIIPDQFRKRHASTRGRCVAIGSEVEYVEVGKEYIWGQHAGAWVTALGVPTTEEADAQFYAVDEADIIAGVA